MRTWKDNRFVFAWGRGFTLLLTIWLAQLFTSAPWLLVGSIIPEDLMANSYVVWGLFFTPLIVFGLVIFYGCCQFMGLTHTDWIRREEPLAGDGREAGSRGVRPDAAACQELNMPRGAE